MRSCNKRELCALCRKKKLKEIYNFGKTPLANNLVKKLDLKVKLFPLAVGICINCKHIQLLHAVKKEILFDKYLYITGISKTFIKHFKSYSLYINSLKTKKKLDNFRILDIGSNDGIFLKNFDNSVSKYAVEPAKNLKNLYKNTNIKLINNYFNNDVRDYLFKKKIFFDFITANNVFAHSDNLDSIFKNVCKILKYDGFFIFEVSYFLNLYKNNSIDSFYHEHISYHTLEPLVFFFKKYNYEINDILKINTHGGSIRLTVSKSGSNKVNNSVRSLINVEKQIKLNNIRNLKSFFYISEKKLTQLINRTSKNAKIIGMGCPAKTVTLLSILYKNKVLNNRIKFILDDSRYKHDKFIPYFNIRIINNDKFKKIIKNYDLIFIFAWNLFEELSKKYRMYFRKKVVIVPYPKTQLLKFK